MIGLNLPIVLSTFLHHSSPSGVRLMDWRYHLTNSSTLFEINILSFFPSRLAFTHTTIAYILSANSKIEIMSLFYLYNIYLRSMKFRPCGYKPAPSVVSSNSEAFVIFDLLLLLLLLMMSVNINRICIFRVRWFVSNIFCFIHTIALWIGLRWQGWMSA